MPAEAEDDTDGVLGQARRLAADVLGPAAMTVEASQRVPREQLDVLAAAGFYGLAGPRDAGGLDVPFPAFCRVIEILASGCLSTTFIWLQHHSAVRAIGGSAPAALRAELLGPMCRGDRRAGLALAGTLPGRPRLRARAVPGGYLFDGTSPWVTGWGHVDLLYTAARDEQDRRTAHPDTYAEMTAYLREAGGFAQAGWCGGEECEARVKADAAATIRCLPLDVRPAATDRCICCGRPAESVAVWAQAY